MEQKHTKMTFIYSLSDPNTKEVRYIGKANNIDARLKSHLRDSKTRNTPVYCWIRKLLKCGSIPFISIVEEVDNWREAEIRIINLYREKGCRLLNLATGGDEPFCSTATREANGKAVAALIHGDPFRKRVWNLKRQMGKSLKYLKDNKRTESYNGIVKKIHLVANKNEKMFGEYLSLKLI